MDVIWSEEDQKFITVPDGDVATHKQIHDYFQRKQAYHRSIMMMPTDIFNNWHHIPRID